MHVTRLCFGAAISMAIASTAVGPAFAQSPPAPGAAAAPVVNGVPVTVTKAVKRDVPIYLLGLGSVSALNSVLIRSRVDGTLMSVGFTEGDEVKKGDVLAQIDPRPYQATLDQALAKKASDEATLANARTDLNRFTQLARNQFAAQQQVDTQRSTVATGEATLKADDALIETARLNLDFSRVTAPFDGRVGLRQIDPGNFVRAADVSTVGIVTLSQIRPISLTFTVPQDNLPAITSAMAEGKPKVLAFSADDKTQLGEGALLTIDNAIDSATGTIKVKATFSNTNNQLWPGQFVNARLLIGTRSGVLTLPSSAVQRGPSGLFVYIVKPDQTVALQPVEVVQDTGTLAVVSKGITGSETIVLSGQSRLSNGARVAATEAPAS
jgi:membrane fusion protein, multidrug efflux system